MLAYIVRRLLLIIPTLFGIMLVNFFIVQAAPGGPIEQVISDITKGASVTGRFSFRTGTRSTTWALPVLSSGSGYASPVAFAMPTTDFSSPVTRVL